MLPHRRHVPVNYMSRDMKYVDTDTWLPPRAKFLSVETFYQQFPLPVNNTVYDFWTMTTYSNSAFIITIYYTYIHISCV